jgi:tetratricopeptide (TPR) repeat protein
LRCCELIQPRAKVCPHCHTSQAHKFKLVANARKWIGGATALISLMLRTYQLHGIWSDIQEKSQTVDEFVRAAWLQVQTGNFQMALACVGEALELEPASAVARDQQVAIAMARVRDIEVYSHFSLDPDQKAVDPLLPFLYRGAVSENETQAADALAHIAWTYHALREFGYPTAEIASYFQEELNKDPQNAYVHAFRAAQCLQIESECKDEDALRAAQAGFEIALHRESSRLFVARLWIESLAHSSIEGARAEAFLAASRLRLRVGNSKSAKTCHLRTSARRGYIPRPPPKTGLEVVAGRRPRDVLLVGRSH